MNFGARPVTIFSGVMVSGGLMLSAFAPNVQFLIFSYGIVVGECLDDSCWMSVDVQYMRSHHIGHTQNSLNDVDKYRKIVCL